MKQLSIQEITAVSGGLTYPVATSVIFWGAGPVLSYTTSLGLSLGVGVVNVMGAIAGIFPILQPLEHAVSFTAPLAGLTLGLLTGLSAVTYAISPEMFGAI